MSRTKSPDQTGFDDEWLEAASVDDLVERYHLSGVDKLAFLRAAAMADREDVFDVLGREALNLLFEHAFQVMSRFMLSMADGDREDALSHAFERLVRYARGQEVSTGFCLAMASDALFYTMARNAHFDIIRSSARRRAREESVAFDRSNKPPDELTDAVLSLELSALLSLLSERERTVLFLRFVEGFTVGEIGEHLGCSTSTVRKLIRRSRMKVQRELTRKQWG